MDTKSIVEKAVTSNQEPVFEQRLAFQPGAILHDAISGSFRAQGDSLEQWVLRNGFRLNCVRAATFCLGKGPKSHQPLARIIANVGLELVRLAYVILLNKHLQDLLSEGLVSLPQLDLALRSPAQSSSGEVGIASRLREERLTSVFRKPSLPSWEA